MDGRLWRRIWWAISDCLEGKRMNRASTRTTSSLAGPGTMDPTVNNEVKISRGSCRKRRSWAAAALFAMLVGLLVPAPAQADHCGGHNERACCINERSNPCNAGHVQISNPGKFCRDNRGDSFCQCDTIAGFPVYAAGICKRIGDCGAEGQRACCIDPVGDPGEAGCDGNLLEISSPTCRSQLSNDDCICSEAANYAVYSDGVCTARQACGGEGQRACCAIESRFFEIGFCEPGLIQEAGCSARLPDAECFCSEVLGAPIYSDGKCVQPDCGQEGQRACCLLERIPGCDDGLVESVLPGCVSELGAENCECGFGPGSSIGVCREVLQFGEQGCVPRVNGDPVAGSIPCGVGFLCVPVILAGDLQGSDLDDPDNIDPASFAQSSFMCVGPGDFMTQDPDGEDSGEELAADLCASLYSLRLQELAISLGQTLTFGIAFTASAGISGTFELGVAYSGDGCYGCYRTTCVGGALEIGIGGAACLGEIFDTSFGSVAGDTCVIDVAFDIADLVVADLGLSFSTVLPRPNDIFCTQGDEVARVQCIGIGIGVDIPFPLTPAFYHCSTESTLVACLNDTTGDIDLAPDELFCSPNEQFIEVCPAPGSSLQLSSLVMNPTSEPVVHLWTTNCPATFDNPTADNPTLTFLDGSNCEANCAVLDSARTEAIPGVFSIPSLAVCGARVINSTTSPTIGTSVSDLNLECGSDFDAALGTWRSAHGGGVATGGCGSLSWDSEFVGSGNTNCTGSAPLFYEFTVEDECNHSITQNASAIPQDTIAPTFTSCPGTVYHESPVGTCTDSVSYTVAASDACGLTSISCVTNNVGATSVTTTGGCFPVGTTTVTCTATDVCDLTTDCVFDVVVNDPPVIVSVSPATEVQYSDKIVPVVVTATDCGPGNSLTLEFDPLDVPNGLALSSTADSCALNASNLVECTWTLSNNDRVLEPEGDYVIDGIKAVDPTQLNGVTLKSAPAETITIQVNAENATIAFDGSNPVAVLVATDGGNSGMFDLTVAVRELNPEMASAGGNLPGDIGLAVMSMTLAPVGPGGGAVGTCTPDNDPNPLDYNDVLTVTCSFDNVGVNIYTVEAVLVANAAGELFYVGSNEDVVVVFDPSLGFTTGGGHIAWPGTGDRTNWGYTMKYNRKRTKIQGSLLLIRHLPDGTKYRIKSNALYGLAIGDESDFGWASFAGKCTYLDPSMVEPVGNHEFVTYVEDHGEPGAGSDRFWLQVFDKDGALIGDLSMDETAPNNAETLVGGNIVVPH